MRGPRVSPSTCLAGFRVGNGAPTDWSTISGPVGFSKSVVQFEVYRLAVGAVLTPKPTGSTGSGAALLRPGFFMII